MLWTARTLDDGQSEHSGATLDSAHVRLLRFLAPGLLSGAPPGPVPDLDFLSVADIPFEL